MKKDYDAIVIGSGFGGSVTALRLSEMGKKVALLERGRQWTTYDFPRQLQEFLMNIRLLKLDKVPLTDKDFPFLEQNELRDIWLSKEDGLFEFKLSSTGMHAVVANGVGGGSLIYACVMIDPPTDVFDTWPKPKDLKGQVLTWTGVLGYDEQTKKYRLCEKVKGMLGVVEVPNDLLSKKKFFKEALEEAKKIKLCKDGQWDEHVYLAHQEVGCDPSRNSDVPSTHPEKCISCANSVLGCRRMAKNTLDSNYIKEAIRHGAHLYPSHEVTAIQPLRDEKGEIVKYRVICEEQHRVFEAPIVVLAAGTLGTTKLLLRCSKEHLGTLPDLSNTLGERFSGNGDFQAGALNVPFDPIKTEREPEITDGPIITSAINFNISRDGKEAVNFVVEDGGVPGAVEGLMALISGQMGELGYLKKLLRDFDLSILANFISELGKFSAKPEETLKKCFMFLCSGRDGASGKIVLKKKGGGPEGGTDIDIEWDWDDPKSQKLYKAMEEELKNLSEMGMGGSYFASPLWSLFGHLITVHPLGGCPMGTGPNDGVVDSDGQVFNYPNLYVADGSIIPTALGVNPSLTIAALAERIADKIAEKMDGNKISVQVTVGRKDS